MRREGLGGPQFPTLFKIGTVGGLSDGELLNRFTSSRGEAAELAFAALVERHGPMVLRVCRSILRDEHAAEDALQATFLILVRRASTVRKQDSIGSWLHGVALRVAACARGASMRRRRHEKRAAELVPTDARDIPGDLDLAPVLHEEVERLPQRYRVVIVLCHLEGLTCEAAAGRLKWPVGTVKSRLARGRERLRNRLVHRGLAPSAGASGLMFPVETVSPALSAALVKSTAQIATFFFEGQAASLGAIPASVAVLTRKVFTLMMMKNLAFSIAIFLSFAVASIGISAFIRGPQADSPAKAQDAPRAQAEDQSAVRPEPVLEDALRAADQISVPWMKAHALADIAVAQARLGQKESSRTTFRRAAQIIKESEDKPELMSANLSWLAKAQALAGDLGEARATVAELLQWAPKIEDEDRRGAYLEIAATRQAKAGDVQSALTLFCALGDAPSSVRAYVLSEIAGEQAKARDVGGARATMTIAETEARRAEQETPPEGVSLSDWLEAVRLAQVRGLAPLARAEAEAGQIDAAHASLERARVLANEIGEDSRAASLALIALAQKNMGDQKASEATMRLAMKTAEELENADRRVEALARIVYEQVDAGDLGSARKTMDRALEVARTAPGKSAIAQQVLAGALPRVGDWEKGRKVALSLRDKITRGNMIEVVTFEQAKAGEPREALKWAEDQSDALLRAHALLGVVRGIIEHATPPSTK